MMTRKHYCITGSDGACRWYRDGQLDRDDGPAVTYPDSRKVWYKNGQLHRVNAPAVYDGVQINSNSVVYSYWYLNSLHREDGPAIEYQDGSTAYMWHGLRHRVDGPAIENADGTNEWWIYGQYMTKDYVALRLLSWSHEVTIGMLGIEDPMNSPYNPQFKMFNPNRKNKGRWTANFGTLSDCQY